MSFGLARGKKLDTTGVGIDQSELPSHEDGRPLKVDPRSWFAHPERRFEIEIGSGKGTFLVRQAALDPETNFLGIEWAGEFYRYAADRMRRRGLTNVKMLRADATEFIRFWCADEVAAVIHLYFSDPWPKKRHHKRRVVQEHTLREFHRVLISGGGGELRLVTDHDALWTWYEDHAAGSAALFERVEFERARMDAKPQAAEGAAEAGGELVGTNFERKYAREGRPFHAMTLVKR